MLDRIALHQTRLKTPGISLDPKGVALGAKGLVLLPSLDRLVGFLALYTHAASLADLMASLSIELVRSKLGSREVVMSFAADSSERMDRMAELARLAGGFVFTGTKRHFVQYRDAAAPFGYDLREILPTDASIALYHTSFSQNYEPERRIPLSSLVLRLEPQLAPESARVPGPRWISAEAGLGPALIQYLVRSRVEAEVALAEWPPASEFDPAPLRRHLFKLESVPERMAPLLATTPGIGVFVPAGPGAAVELGYRHPINLRACPVFPPEGLVLLRGRGLPAIVLDKLPSLGPVSAFARVQWQQADPPAGKAVAAARSVDVPLRLALDTKPWRHITATMVPRERLGLLRQLSYRLSRKALEQTTIAFTPEGAVVQREQGVEGIPVGDFFQQVHPSIFVSAGYAAVPDVSPEVLFHALGSPASELVFLRSDGRRVGIAKSAFVALEQALLEAQTWTGLATENVAPALSAALPQVTLESPGFRPLRDVGGEGSSGSGAASG